MEATEVSGAGGRGGGAHLQGAHFPWNLMGIVQCDGPATDQLPLLVLSNSSDPAAVMC